MAESVTKALESLHAYLQENWEALLIGRPKDPVLAWVILAEKARRGLSNEGCVEYPRWRVSPPSNSYHPV